MIKNLEDHCIKLEKGVIVPSGRHFAYRLKDGREIELPFAMADLLLMSDGEHSLYQTLVKMHEKQGVVHFRKVIETILHLYEGNFIENQREIQPLVKELQRVLSPSPSFSLTWLASKLKWFVRGFKKRNFLKEEVKQKLIRNSFFSELEEDVLHQLLNECEVIFFSRHQTVIHRGESPEDIYLLLEGECVAETDGFSGSIQSGSFFGEGVLRPQAARLASVQTSSSSYILRIPSQALEKLFLNESQKESLRQQIIVSQFFGSSPHFQGVQEETIERFQRSGQLEIVDSERTIFEDGEPATGLYFLVRGSVRVEVSEDKVIALNQGEIFGEISAMAKLPRTAKVVTQEPSFLFKVSLEAFWEILLADLIFSYQIEKLCEQRLSEDIEILQRKTLKAG